MWHKLRPHLKYGALRSLLAIRWLRKRQKVAVRTAFSSKVILTLTSYPPRFPTLHLTLQSLLAQSVAPARTILWIATEDMDQLPLAVRELQRYGLEIRECVNRRSFDKLVHALSLYPNMYFVIADDDVLYQEDWMETLLAAYSGNDREIICHRAHRMTIDDKGEVIPYRQWEKFISIAMKSKQLFPTGIGGVLYSPGIFSEDVLKSELYQTLCPAADDIWFYFMALRNGATVRTTGARQRFALWPSTEAVELKNDNTDGDGNDRQLQAMIAKFGLPFGDTET